MRAYSPPVAVAPSVVTAYSPPVAVAPAPTYSAYAVPAAAPVISYSPAVVAPVPILAGPHYVNGQPIRNFFRALAQ